MGVAAQVALHLPTDERPALLAATRQYIAAATRTTITTYSSTPSDALAHWTAPSPYAISAIEFSPDATVLAAVIHRTSDSALVLLCSLSLSRLLRVALSPSVGPRPSLAFVASPCTTADHQYAALLPPRLLPAFTRLSRQDGTRPSISTENNPAVKYALAISSQHPECAVAIYAFHSSYRRLHHVTTLSHPPLCTLYAVPNLSTTVPELVIVDHMKATLHHYAADVAHIFNPKFHVRDMLAVVTEPQHAVVAIVEHPVGHSSVAVLRSSSTTLTPIPDNAPNLGLLPTPRPDEFLIATVAVARVSPFAKLILRPHIVIDVVPVDNELPQQDEKLLLPYIPPRPHAPLSLFVKDDYLVYSSC